MKKITYLSFIIAITLVLACNSKSEQSTKPITQKRETEKEPKKMLQDAYQLFKEGKDKESLQLANKVLEIGRKTNNDTLVGNALTSMCRNAQRTLDTTKLAELSDQLKNLAETSGNKKWLMYRAHQNAEMWRLVGNMDRAEQFYNESMALSEEIGSKGMFMIDHFNKSFVSTAKGDFKEAERLIKKYYELRREMDSTKEDAYGLIALAYLLEQKENYQGAHEVATVTRRLFNEQNIFPEPPDEKPLIGVEIKVKQSLPEKELLEIEISSLKESVSSLLEKYL